MYFTVLHGCEYFGLPVSHIASFILEKPVTFWLPHPTTFDLVWRDYQLAVLDAAELWDPNRRHGH